MVTFHGVHREIPETQEAGSIGVVVGVACAGCCHAVPDIEADHPDRPSFSCRLSKGRVTGLKDSAVGVNRTRPLPSPLWPYHVK